MTRAVVVLREGGQAELVDADTREVLTSGPVDEMEVRAYRVMEIHERHARIREIISQADGNLTGTKRPRSTPPTIASRQLSSL